MSAKTVPLSVRLPRDDAEFIARLKTGDAVTMSEKVRQLVSDARLAAERGDSFEGVVEQAAGNLSHVTRALDALEADHGRQSRLLRVLVDWLPRIQAELEAVNVPPGDEVDSLTALEAAAARRTRDFVDQMARLAVTREAPCLDGSIVRTTLEPLSELFGLIAKNPDEGSTET
ncbi:MAG: hypothetical protein EP335_17740 [Alphaproteobacteria bacterium]|nr:MAG: hypothetical protein EP335_17740 [Alphaproteobacteria bacterium]